MVKILCFQSRGRRFNFPQSGNEDHTCCPAWPKKKKEERQRVSTTDYDHPELYGAQSREVRWAEHEPSSLRGLVYSL